MWSLLLLLLGSTLTFQLKQIIIIWASFSIGRAMRQQQLKLSWAELSVLLERVKRSHPKRIRHGYRSELDFVCDSMPRYDLRLYVDLIVSFVFLAYAKLISDLTSSVAASFACSVCECVRLCLSVTVGRFYAQTSSWAMRDQSRSHTISVSYVKRKNLIDLGLCREVTALCHALCNCWEYL